MGLYIQSLENIIPHEKGIIILLAWLWMVRTLGEALMKNFEKMAA